MRADARENRARILAAAREVVAEGGEFSMNQVAQRAGVGPGTLYRNFPTREALAVAIYELDIDRLLAAVPALLADLTPLEALRRWTTDLVGAMRTKHGLGEALSPGDHKRIVEQTYDPVVAAIDRMLDAGKADGSIRTDAEPGDFLQLTGALWRAPQDRTEPLLDFLLDGLTARTSPRRAPRASRTQA